LACASRALPAACPSAGRTGARACAACAPPPTTPTPPQVDAAGFEAAMEEARQKSRAGGRKAGVSGLLAAAVPAKRPAPESTRGILLDRPCTHTPPSSATHTQTRTHAHTHTQQGVGLRFEAEATGWLQGKAVPTTDDGPKYGERDVTAKVLAILTPGARAAAQLGAACAACRLRRCVGRLAVAPAACLALAACAHAARQRHGAGSLTPPPQPTAHAPVRPACP
jgi:hypothetical protein